jgi:hypothetical protein
MFLKKTTKLLSVLLAVVMMLSCFTMGAFAAKATYQTGAQLNTLGAYSPDGSVTRLSTEERMSILLDWLDLILYDVNFEGIDFTGNYIIVNVDLHVHINSVDQILASVDSVKSNLSSSLVKSMVGDLGDLSFSGWQTGMSRNGTAQITILYEIAELLKTNAGLLETILAKGNLDAGGIVNGKIPRAKLNKILGDIPGLILSKLYPLMSRKDDTTNQAKYLFEGKGFVANSTPSATLNTFVNNLFNKAQSTTTYKENAAGQCISGHNLPTVADADHLPTAPSDSSLRYYYVKSGSGDNTIFTAYVYNPEKEKYEAEEAVFKRSEESEGVYTYKTDAGDGLKYYKNGTYWLPSFVGQSVNVNTESAAALLYKFAPYVFADLAPIALNGFCKQALATWMGATETKIFEGKAGEGSAVLADLPAAVQDFFTAAVPYYQFSYSNYLAYSDDTQYYRYVDKDTNNEEWFVLDMTTGNDYLGLFNFGYTVSGDFLNEFIPGQSGAKSTLFQSINDFLVKAAQTILKPEVFNSLGLQTGDNTYFVSNIRKAAQALLPEDATYGGQPDAILGPDYMHHYDGYYQTLISTDASNDEVVTALAAIIAKALMPQLILPSAENLAGQKLGAVLACVVRELVTQMLPTYNYDALIFSDYNTRTLVSGKDNEYWLDVILTMGLDVGMSYLKELTDLGEDQTGGFVWSESKTYTAASFAQKGWEDTVDWVIDWALTADASKEWCWYMSRLVDVSGLTIDLGTAQDPWVKLDKILNDLLPLKQIINCTAASGKTWLETVLRDKLILGIADLKFEYIFGKGTDYTASGNAGLLSIPSNSILRTKGAVPAIFEVVRDLLNKVIYKVAGDKNLFDTSTFTGIDTLVGKYQYSSSYKNAPNLLKPVSVLLRNLYTAIGTYNLLQPVLPIVNMFLGWKTGSQELDDPGIVWGGDYVFRSSKVNDGIELRFTNKSAGMLLKNWKATGEYDYEKAYNLVIDGISASGLTFTLNSGYSTTIAPYGRAIYTVKASSVPSADTGTRVEIKYHYQGKDGSNIGGTQYAYTFITYSKNENISGSWSGELKKETGLISKTVHVNTSVSQEYNPFFKSYEELENANERLKITFANGAEYAAKFTTLTYTASNAAWIKVGPEISANQNKILAVGETLELHPCILAKAPSSYVTGNSYATGKTNVTLKRNDNNNSASGEYNLGNLYFADMGELMKIYDAEFGANRKASDYTNATAFNNYLTAMNNATVLMRGPVNDSTFASRYTASNISSVTTALENAVKAIEECKKDAISKEEELQEGLADSETAALIGADDQINFQDFELYGYWLYEKNRTTARDLMKEYQGPQEPQKYIENCWLPYSGSDKNEDLTHVLAAESNTTKKEAIEDTIEDPAQSAMDAYYAALNEWKMPEYSDLYVADICSKLNYYNDFLKPRTYSTEAAGRAQLSQEIAYANAQGYNQADYTAKSWARYADALAKAQALMTRGSGKMQSYIFEAKYDLLKAQRDLRLKAYDYATVNGYSELQALVDLAEGMFQNADYFTAVDGTLDTEWTDLLEALGYEANFGTGTDAWSMNLYADSAEQLMTEELDSRSARNDDRVAAVTTALRDAINALKCTIEVIKNDATTVVDQEIKFITNIAPLSLSSVDDVLTHVKASSNAATLAVTKTAKGFGTGTIVSATIGNIPIATYFVVVYGDVNGDDAIDGFDAARSDAKLANGASFTTPQEKAADVDKGGTFDVNDVSAILAAAAGSIEISQA